MMYVQKTLDWAKANPLSVAAIAVVLICALAWPLMAMRPGRTFQARVQSEANKQLREVNAFLEQKVEVPPRTADGAAETVSMVVNQSAIDKRAWINRRVNEEYEAIYQQAIGFNAAGHQPMLAGLFPKPENDSLPVVAREAYLKSFPAMLEGYDPDAALPRLNAGMPPSATEINAELAKVDQEFAAEFGDDAVRSPSPELAEERKRRQQQRLKDVLTRRARGIHIYAETTPGGPSPFDIGGWASLSSIPDMEEVWESQLSLWIQQDVVEAIARTNRVDNPTYDVTMMPVKRLIKIDVLDGYVGIDTLGGISGEPGAAGTSGGRRRGGQSGGGDSFVMPELTVEEMIAMGMMPAGSGSSSGSSSRKSDSSGLPALEEEVEETIEPLDLPSRDYSVGHTGRTSTRYYDVRHVWLTVVVDSARLIELLDNLSKVNFITVLKVGVRDVDEYDALRDGYVYGSGDAVEANILLETVWLRHWTNPLMPISVRQKIGAVDLEPIGQESAG